VKAADEFTTLEAAMAYRRSVSPVLAARSAEDQHEPALGVLHQRPDGRSVWKMDSACIRQRIEHGPPARPPVWPALQVLPCPTLVVWSIESDVLSEAQARRMVDVLPRGELVRVPGIGHAPTLVEPVVLAALGRFLGGLHAR
jgi:pimeloyl-ACP methyl ester carboxylesterase